MNTRREWADAIAYAANQARGCTGADTKHAELECFIGEMNKMVLNNGLLRYIHYTKRNGYVVKRVKA